MVKTNVLSHFLKRVIIKGLLLKTVRLSGEIRVAVKHIQKSLEKEQGQETCLGFLWWLVVRLGCVFVFDLKIE